ncbi:alpha/beta fold hydrolase [Nocardia stercoris]|uniref:Alpha/beta hydrolase n=1 Tax=Nocardia stercoris TaxID=2483361 RepID=A0A3M2KRV5_9NOCA|nr:alpha/beta hydrolase [Nocardia stercoris]RMI28387.1 alpha/beta hydrolase [Nocardia stercoris]
MSVVRRGGVEISFDDSGGEGRAIVLGHSLFLDRGMFAAQVAALAPRYRVITIDSRGHGDSRDDGTPFSFWDLARDAWAVVDALGLERVVVGGVGHGGFTAQRMALLAQSRVDGLITIGSSATAMDPKRRRGFREAIDAWIDSVHETTTSKMIASLMIGGTAQDQDPWRHKWLAGDRSRVRGAADCLLNRDSVLELLGEIRCPTLVVRGAGDYAAGAADSAALAAGLGLPTVVHNITGASVTPNLTHPHEVNELLCAFLAELPAATATAGSAR